MSGYEKSPVAEGGAQSPHGVRRVPPTPDTKPMRAGAQGFREPLRVPRVDGVCRPIHPHLAGHLFHDQRPPGRFFFRRFRNSVYKIRTAEPFSRVLWSGLVPTELGKDRLYPLSLRELAPAITSSPWSRVYRRGAEPSQGDAASLDARCARRRASLGL